MDSYSEMLEHARAEVDEINVEGAHEMLKDGREVVYLVDIRSRYHMALGYIKGAALIPAEELQMSAHHLLADKSRPVLLYCESGRRSLLTGLSLKKTGYRRVISMTGGMTAWREAGYDVENETLLSQDQLTRYSRQMLLPEVGVEGQLKLLNARVLLVGAGGLGSPVALYLAAAGVGTIGIADFDVVEKSNLNRQVIHADANAGKLKTESAREGVSRINPDVRVIAFNERAAPENIAGILKDFDILVDGSDNFQTKYLLNDAAFFAGKPYIFGGAVRTEGQAAVFFPKEGGPCLRCLVPQPPPQDLAPT